MKIITNANKRKGRCCTMRVQCLKEKEMSISYYLQVDHKMKNLQMSFNVKTIFLSIVRNVIVSCDTPLK